MKDITETFIDLGRAVADAPCAMKGSQPEVRSQLKLTLVCGGRRWTRKGRQLRRRRDL